MGAINVECPLFSNFSEPMLNSLPNKVAIVMVL